MFKGFDRVVDKHVGSDNTFSDAFGEVADKTIDPIRHFGKTFIERVQKREPWVVLVEFTVIIGAIDMAIVIGIGI